MEVRTFTSRSSKEIDMVVNTWLSKNYEKINLHDIKVQIGDGFYVYVIIYDHYAIEEIED